MDQYEGVHQWTKEDEAVAQRNAMLFLAGVLCAGTAIAVGGALLLAKITNKREARKQQRESQQ